MTLVEGHPDPSFTFELVPLDATFVDTSYQRAEYGDNVKAFANDWSDVLAQAIIVVRRPDGMYAVVDGQTRRAAALLIGRRHIWSQVLEAVTIEYEALLFAELQLRRRSIRPFDLYRAELRGGRANVLAIHAEVARRDLYETGSSGLKSAPESIGAIAALKEIYARGGAVLLGRTLDVIRAGFPQAPGRFRNEILRAVARLLHEPDTRDWRLVLALESFTRDGHDGPTELVTMAAHRRQSTPNRGRAQGGHSEGYMVAVLRDAYDAQRTTRPRAGVPTYVH